MTLNDLMIVATDLDAMSIDTLKDSWSVGGIAMMLEDAYILKDDNEANIRWLGVFDDVTDEFTFYERPGLDEIAEADNLINEYKQISKIVRVLEDSIDELI